MSAPLVSVLVPTYDGERYVGAAVESALAQTHERLEVLVGDDASTDGTPEVLAALAARDERVRVIRHPRNVGAFENPILLLEAARGEHVKFLLHDDVLAPTCVETLVAPLADPVVMLATSKRGTIDGDGNPLPDPPGFGRLTTAPVTFDGVEFGDMMLARCQNLVGELSTAMFRRADVDPRTLWHVDGRRLAGLGDLALWLDLLARGGLRYVPEDLSWFRRHDAQRTGDPGIHAGGVRDWPLLIDWAARHGFLADAGARRQALATALQMAANAYAALRETPHGATALDAAGTATRLLAELHRYPVALAAPAVEADEIDAVVTMLASLRERADRLVIAFPPAAVEAAVPLVEAALERTGEFELDLVPVDDPAELYEPSWLAVTGAGGAPWAHGHVLRLA